MKLLGFRKRGGAEVHYRIEKRGLFTFVHFLDVSGKPVAVVEIEREVIEGMLRDF